MAIRQEGNTYYGLSTDTKPTGAVLNGREFKEMDTGKKYLFDAENGERLEQPEEGGGGGGGVIMAQIDGQTGAMNMTWQELHDAMLGGNLVYAVNHYTETGYDAAALFLLYEVVIEEGHYIVSLIDPGESHKEIGEASGGANDYPVFSF